jgi:hypothetical protein
MSLAAQRLVEPGCQWLHCVDTHAGLGELVANCHRLTPAIRKKIMDVFHGKS